METAGRGMKLEIIFSNFYASDQIHSLPLNPLCLIYLLNNPRDPTKFQRTGEQIEKNTKSQLNVLNVNTIKFFYINHINTPYYVGTPLH